MVGALTRGGVHGIGEHMWLISRRYRCYQCCHVFNAHDDDVMLQMPDFIKNLFPVSILGNKLAVTKTLQQLLRVMISSGKGCSVENARCPRRARAHDGNVK